MNESVIEWFDDEVEHYGLNYHLPKHNHAIFSQYIDSLQHVVHIFLW